jgi:anaerobic magnesium-protoporphyrin IX monomethyl ester cyclase
MKILFVCNRFENLGVEILSAFLKSKGHEVELAFDPQLFNDGYLTIPFLAKKFDSRRRILKRVGSFKPDLIAFSVLTDNYLWAINISKLIKERYSIPIVFGGIHPTSVPEIVMKNNCVDFVIRGEGEYALLELITALEKDKSFSKINNLVFKKNNFPVINGLRNFISDLDSLPYPDKDLFYKFIPYAKKTYTIMTSRGCPFNCTYCFNHMLKKIHFDKGKYLRKRSVDNVIGELRKAKLKYGFNFVSILDDVFMFDNEWLKDFCKKYKEEINIPFRCIGHVNFITEENASLLKIAGCKIIQIGIQTTCDYTRKNIINRNETNETIERSSKIIKNHHIKLEVDHILGFPYETGKEQIEAAKFYNLIRPDIINTYWLKCFPKTTIIKHMLEDNKLTIADVDRIERGYGVSYISGGSVKNRKELQKFYSLLNMIPLLPQDTIRFIIKNRLYFLIDFGKPFLIFTRIIKSFFWKDIRLFEFLTFYKHYLSRNI